jgi:predicted metal-binding membrane protein
MVSLARRLAAPDPRRLAWAAAGFAALAGWIGLAALRPGAALDWQTFLALCATPGAAAPAMAALPGVAAMWLLMAPAMMAPTAAPAIGVYASLVARDRAAGAPGLRVASFLGGYLAVWGAVALGAAALQVALARAAAGLDARVVGGALLALAGLWQRSALKAACLAACRSPMAFFLARWREGAGGAFALGARHGAVCVGCCWALMLLMLGFGAMSLGWMAALALAMAAEKVAPGAERLARPLGLAAIAGGGALALSAL